MILLNSCGAPEHYYNKKLNEFEQKINDEKERFWDILDRHCDLYLSSLRDTLSTYRVTSSCLESDKRIKVATFVNSNGIITETLPSEYKQFKGTDISQQAHVQYIKKNKVRFISRKFKSVQGFSAISFIKPIVENNKLLGTLNILIEPHKLIESIFNTIDLPENSRRMVIQGDGVVLFSDLVQFRNSNVVTYKNYPDDLADNLIETIGIHKIGEVSFFYQFENKKIKLFWKQIPMEKDKWTVVIINTI